jgi:pyruvate dehydrogenase E1 component
MGTVDIMNRDKTLTHIQNRVLWLAIQMVHYANKARASADGVKVGGHMASSSSVVTVMTYLFFEYLRRGDKISIKPHASPVYHAVQFLLGNLEPQYLKALRALHGLQSYPSRTKDPDGVHFSTGSMGLGAIAPNFAAVVNDYVHTHFGQQPGGERRYISLVGDAELDEGAVWEAIAEPALMDLSNILWVVDINRQSLDRVIPGIRVRCWKEMFKANGWQVIEAKYGKRLQAAFQQPHGELLHECIENLSNDAYQRLLRLPPEHLREWLPQKSHHPKEMEKLLSLWSNPEISDIFGNLGGPDIEELREAFSRADAVRGPKAIFVYTQKGWMLPSVGHPQNHSLLLTTEQMEQLRARLEIPEDGIWQQFDPESDAGQMCLEARNRLKPETEPRETAGRMQIPDHLRETYSGGFSTQQIFGSVLTSIARDFPELAERIVTVSPDVASSTNLGGWINKMDVWSRTEREVLPEETEPGALKWNESIHGQHIELGISENNLFMALGQLGLSHELAGEILFPIGTLYDCFVPRGLDAFYYGVYSGAQFIVVGTPSGITLSTEGGAHQSIITESIGIELPGVSFYEPCFGQELEWIIMAALDKVRRRSGSTYLRLTSKRVDQSLFPLPEGEIDRAHLRNQVIRGAYRLVDASFQPGYEPGSNVVHIFASGAMIPEAILASRQLKEQHVFANVFNVTGAGPLYREFQDAVHSRQDIDGKPSHLLEDLVSLNERTAPAITVVDGHPHTLAWIGAALNMRTAPLGVVGFGQSGSCADLYREYKIDVGSIVSKCLQSVSDSMAPAA